MNVVTLPYGIEGWREKMRLVEKMLALRSGPPFVYDDMLILVPSARMKRDYGRLFIQTIERLFGTTALVPPEVQTLHQFLYLLNARLNGPSLMDENSRLVLFEGIVKELITGKAEFGPHPDILAPSLSAAVADLIDRLSSAGITSERLSATVAASDFADKPQVRLLTAAYARYDRMLADNGLLDPPGMLAVLADRFEGAWLAPYSRIIIDGIHDGNATVITLLRKIIAHANCTLMVDAPSPESIRRAGEYHPLRLVAEFLGGLGQFPAPTPSTAAVEDQFLSETLFTDKPFASAAALAPPPDSFAKDLRLLSAVNTREEVSFIAGEVKKSLRSGTPPDSILVVFPSLDDYGPLAEEIFRDHGIPYNRALGRQLSASPVTTAVISLLRACQEDFSGTSLIRILSSPFLKFGEQPSLAPALDLLLRTRRITGGKEKLLRAFKDQPLEEHGVSLLAEPLRDLFIALDPFATQEAAPLTLWMNRLNQLMAWSGVRLRVATIKGPLNVNLQAFKKLNETLASLNRAGRLFPAYRYSFNEWLFLLRKTFLHTRFQVPPEDEGGVQILGLLESVGHAWSEIYLGGLVDGKFPQRLSQNIFLPEHTLETMGVRSLERARTVAAYHFYRLLLSAPKVTVTYPENEGDRPVVPSPFLQELTPLKTSRLINKGIETTSGIQFSLKIEESRSISELAKAISITADRSVLSDILGIDIPGMPGIRSAVNAVPAAPASPATPFSKRDFSVTELDDYINCPYDYYITHVLGFEPLEEVSEDISPRDRGSKVHAILRNFYLSWKSPVSPENRQEAAALLRRLADSAFGSDADTFRNRRERELFMTVMAARFLDAEEEVWKQGYRPAHLEQKLDAYPLTLTSGETIELSGKVDRIDVDANGDFIIVDYKSGKYPLPKIHADQDIFQLPVYAIMTQHTVAHGHIVGLRRPIGLAYYDLLGKTSPSARDVVLFNKDARAEHPSSKPKASQKSADEFEAILSQSMDKARAAVEAILAGNFTSPPRDKNKCRFCPGDVMCGSNSLKGRDSLATNAYE